VSKPYKGRITDWKIYRNDFWLKGYFCIVGKFEDHPEFRGRRGHTSIVTNMAMCPDSKEPTYHVETMNSQYLLIGAPSQVGR